MSASIAFLALACCVVSFIATHFVLQRYSRSIIDTPNERSSHDVPTPRGGGVGFVAVTATVFAFLAIFMSSSRPLWLALLCGLPIAAVGWADDRWNIGPLIRIAVQGACATWGLWCLGGMGNIMIGGLNIPLGILGYPIAFFGIIWCVNLYNFIDGLDGYAAMEAVSIALFGAIAAYSAGSVPIAIACAAIGGAVAGFVPLNWAPARIFMGDVGSCTLGYYFAVLVAASQTASGGYGTVPVTLWLVLGGVFFVDATATLVARIKRREKVWQAHREHAYQRIVRFGVPHRTVTIYATLFNMGAGILAVRIGHWGGLVLLLLYYFALLWIWNYTRDLPADTPGTRKV